VVVFKRIQFALVQVSKSAKEGQLTGTELSRLPANPDYNSHRRCNVKEYEILKTIGERRNENHRFVKWWRNESDFLDYDLIEKFVEDAGSNKELGGFDLLTMDDMWNELKRIAGTRVKLVHDATGDNVEWVYQAKSGTKIQVCAYTPETLMTIFDVETKGNPVD
jgi:hypothetical protein